MRKFGLLLALGLLVTSSIAPSQGVIVAISPPSSVTVAPTVSTSAYTAGFVLGGVESFIIPAGGVTLQSVITNFNTGAYVGGVDWLLFNANPSNGGTTDRAALAIVAADQPKLIGVIHATDCKLTATVTSYCQSGNSPMFIRLASGNVLYVVKQVIGAPTFTNATDVSDTINVVQ